MCSRDLLSRNRFAKHEMCVHVCECVYMCVCVGGRGVFTARCPLLKKKKKNPKGYSLFLLMFPSPCPPSIPPSIPFSFALQENKFAKGA